MRGLAYFLLGIGVAASIYLLTLEIKTTARQNHEIAALVHENQIANCKLKVYAIVDGTLAVALRQDPNSSEYSPKLARIENGALSEVLSIPSATQCSPTVSIKFTKTKRGTKAELSEKTNRALSSLGSVTFTPSHVRRKAPHTVVVRVPVTTVPPPISRPKHHVANVKATIPLPASSVSAPSAAPKQEGEAKLHVKAQLPPVETPKPVSKEPPKPGPILGKVEELSPLKAAAGVVTETTKSTTGTVTKTVQQLTHLP